ncbi:MAG: alpha/beta hydrolase [Firmicutes bacterium]|nr:alpha/beta hydrolase [Bacillota bacterium]
MKKIVKLICILLALLLIAAACFLFYCRVINHRSFMAGFVDLVLKLQKRSDKFMFTEEAEKYIEQKAEENKEPVVIDKAKFGISIKEEDLDPLQAFIYNDLESPEVTVFYFHGGAYINQPNNQQKTMAARTAKETGAEVVLMVYPKEPVYECKDAYEVCEAYYLEYIEKNECGKIVFMGDSAGGGLALGLAEVLKAERKKGPDELVLISPWVDVTMSNQDMWHYLDLDPMLGIEGLRKMGEVWAGELDMEDPMVSPIYGDLKGLCPVTLTTGTWEVLYPDTLLLKTKLEEAGVKCTYIEGMNMIHCYPITPIPEAKEALELIWDAITR